jgi:AsmA protein
MERIMSDDSMAYAAESGGRKAWRTVKRLVRLTFLGALIVLALLIAFPPVNLLKDQLASSISASTGRDVRIGGARVTYYPEMTLALERITVANPPGMVGPVLFRAKSISAKLTPMSLINRDSIFDTLTLQEPEAFLEEDASGARNWILAGSPGGTFGLPLPRTISIHDGWVSFTSAKTGGSYDASSIAALATCDQKTGAVAAKGRLDTGKEGVTFDVALGDAYAAAAGGSSTLKAGFEARPARARIEGTALFASLAEFSGDLSASSGSLFDLMHWMGAEKTASGDPFKASLNGKIKATTRDVAFTETDVLVNASASRFEGRLDFAGARPKLEGNIASERIDLVRLFAATKRMTLVPEALAAPGEELQVEAGWNGLLADLEALEGGKAGLAAEAETASSLEVAPAAAAWSDEPFNLNGIKAFDADLTMTAQTLAYGGLEFTDARIKAGITDGLLDATLETTDVAKGKANGTLSIDSRSTPPAAQLALKLANVEAEPVVNEIAGKPLFSGTSNVDITAKAQGQNTSQLTSTLEGKARFQMAKGAIRGFDVRRMISEWWRSWTFDLAMKTGFERLEAQYDIKNGIMKSSPDLELQGSEVTITSSGAVNVAARKLKQDIRIKVVPPPTALPIPVRISGDWAKPTIGIDWGGLFSSAAGLGGPQAVTPAGEPVPGNVQATINRVLAANLPPEKLSDGAKEMLRSLVAGGQQP